MKKGAWVKVFKGRKIPIGTLGTVFWVGEDGFEEGKRVGIEAEDGNTYWTSAANVEATKEKGVEIVPPGIGSSVRFEEGDVTHTGEVFWVGPSKSGRGFRIGIKCDDGQTRWSDARRLEVLELPDA